MRDNIIGQRFGKLFVQNYVGVRGKSDLWRCVCDCGKIIDIIKQNLTNKNGTRSCGCLKQSLKQGEYIICIKCDAKQIKDNFYFKDRRKTTRHNICKKCLRTINKELKKVRDRLHKLTALEHYGGIPPKCACCGESHIEFLTIDHINGGGRKHIRQVVGSGGGRIYRWLKKNSWPEGFRVLCFNCNASIGLYGYCPHHSSISNIQRSSGSLARHKRLVRHKLMVLEHYSSTPPVCACCNESHIEFLTIDHINGGGSKHNRAINRHIYSWLISHKYPIGYRILCLNCNCSHGMFKYCPHEKGRINVI